MGRIREAIKETKINVNELAIYMGVDPYKLDKYLALYEAFLYADIPSDIKKKIDYFANHSYSPKYGIIHHLMEFDEYDNGNEEHPFVKKFYITLKTLIPVDLIDELMKNNIEFDLGPTGVWYFSIFDKNIEFKFRLLDINRNDDIYEGDLPTAIYVHGLLDVTMITDKIVEAYTNTRNREEILKSLIKYFEDVCSGIDSPFIEKYDDIIDSLTEEEKERNDLINEISSIVKDLDCWNEDISIEKLRVMKAELEKFVPEYEVLWAGNIFYVIKNRHTGLGHLCFTTLSSDKSVPSESVKVFEHLEFSYYSIKELNSKDEINNAIKIAKYLNTIS